MNENETSKKEYKTFLRVDSGIYELACRIQEEFPDELAIDVVGKYGIFCISETLYNQKHPMIRLSRDQIHRFFDTILNNADRIKVIKHFHQEFNIDKVKPLELTATYDDIEDFLITHCDRQKDYDDGSLTASIFSHIEQALSFSSEHFGYVEKLWDNILQKPQKKCIIDAINNDQACFC